MRFCIDKNAVKIKGRLVYRSQDYAFDFIPHQEVDTSLLFCNLSLDFDSETMQARQIWGLHPQFGWKQKKMSVPQAVPGGLFLKGSENFIKPGQIKRIVECGEWTSYIDQETGWIYFGEIEIPNTGETIEFAENIIVVVNDGKISAFWLRPLME